jgi:hypothetical protein
MRADVTRVLRVPNAVRTQYLTRAGYRFATARWCIRVLTCWLDRMGHGGRSVSLNFVVFVCWCCVM